VVWGCEAAVFTARQIPRASGGSGRGMASGASTKDSIRYLLCSSVDLLATTRDIESRAREGDRNRDRGCG
jgi:hypothetical protein